MLAELSPELAELAQSGNELEFGIHYGRHVEFEYEVAFAPDGASRIGADSFRLSPIEPPRSASLVPALNATADVNPLHGLIAVSTARYKEWLAQIKRERLPLD